MGVHQSKEYLIQALVKYSLIGAIRGKHPSWGFQEITSFLAAPVWGLYAIYCVNFRSAAMLRCSTTFPLKMIRKFWGIFKYNIEAYTCIHNCQQLRIIQNPTYVHNWYYFFGMRSWIVQHKSWKRKQIASSFTRNENRYWLLICSSISISFNLFVLLLSFEATRSWMSCNSTNFSIQH